MYHYSLLHSSTTTYTNIGITAAAWDFLHHLLAKNIWHRSSNSTFFQRITQHQQQATNTRQNMAASSHVLMAFTSVIWHSFLFSVPISILLVSIFLKLILIGFTLSSTYLTFLSIHILLAFFLILLKFILIRLASSYLAFIFIFGNFFLSHSFGFHFYYPGILLLLILDKYSISSSSSFSFWLLS